VPGWHVVQPVQLDALLVVLYVLAAHAEHVRFAVALPAVATRWPGVQEVHAAHAVAASPSWSHVPELQACFGAVAPAQYVPVSQAAQATGEVGVASAVCSDPAAHDPAGRQLDWFAEEE